jgi:hypothetical protein
MGHIFTFSFYYINKISLLDTFISQTSLRNAEKNNIINWGKDTSINNNILNKTVYLLGEKIQQTNNLRKCGAEPCRAQAQLGVHADADFILNVKFQ